MLLVGVIVVSEICSAVTGWNKDEVYVKGVLIRSVRKSNEARVDVHLATFVLFYRRNSVFYVDVINYL